MLSKFTKALYDAESEDGICLEQMISFLTRIVQVQKQLDWVLHLETRTEGCMSASYDSFLQSCRHLELFSWCLRPVSSVKFREPVVGAGSHVLEQAMGVALFLDAVYGILIVNTCEIKRIKPNHRIDASLLN